MKVQGFINRVQDRLHSNVLSVYRSCLGLGFRGQNEWMLEEFAGDAQKIYIECGEFRGYN